MHRDAACGAKPVRAPYAQLVSRRLRSSATASSTAYTLRASELDQLRRFLDDGAAFGCPGNGDSATAPKLERSLEFLQQTATSAGRCGLDAETVARSRAGGCRSPGFASPSAIARRIWAAT